MGLFVLLDLAKHLYSFHEPAKTLLILVAYIVVACRGARRQMLRAVHGIVTDWVQRVF